MQIFDSTAAEDLWLLQKAANDLGGSPVRLTGLILGGNQMWSDITRTIDMTSDKWESEYLELWRKYDPTALCWGALQMLLQQKDDAYGHLTPSQIGAIFQAEPSLFRNLIAGMTKRCKSDRPMESKHKLRHLVTTTDRLYRAWVNVMASLRKKQKIAA